MVETDEAVNDPEVVDPRITDGVDVDVEGIDSDFGTESESDDEDNAFDNSKRVIADTEPPVTPSREDELDSSYDQLLGDAKVRKMLNTLMDEKLKTAKKEWLAENNKASAAKETGNEVRGSYRSPIVNNGQITKSPSDTTIY